MHGVADRYALPLTFYLTPGHAADRRAPEHLLADLPERRFIEPFAGERVDAVADEATEVLDAVCGVLAEQDLELIKGVLDRVSC